MRRKHISYSYFEHNPEREIWMPYIAKFIRTLVFDIKPEFDRIVKWKSKTVNNTLSTNSFYPVLKFENCELSKGHISNEQNMVIYST